MRFLNPMGLWWATLAIPVLLLYILKPKRPPRVVSSIFLWTPLERPITAAKPFRMIRPSWLLFLQLLAVALLTIAIANPVLVSPASLAEHTVFLIDGSGSMLAQDGTPDRLADAKARAREVRRELPTGGIASVIEVGPRPRVMLSSSPDINAFDEAVEVTSATTGRADFAAAFALAEGLETPNSPIGFVLVSDGGLTEEEQRLLPAGTTYEQVGSDADNRAIVGLDVEALPNELYVAVTLANRGRSATTQTLRLDVDGRTRERVELDFSVGRTFVYETTLTVGDRVDAYLEGEDLLAADNYRTAVSWRRQPIRVRLVGNSDLFIDALLSAVDGIKLVQDGDSEGPDLIIYNQSAVPAEPSTPFLAIRPPGGVLTTPGAVPAVSVVGEVTLPALTLFRSDDSLLQGIDLSELAVATAQQVQTDTAEVLLGAESAPLLLRGRTNGVRFAYLAFQLADSNLPLQLAFPLLGDRLLSELTGTVLPPAAIEVGRVLDVPSQLGAVITDPSGAVSDLAPGTPGFVTDQPGLWSIDIPDRPTMFVAVNSASTESILTPVPGLPTKIRQPRPGEDPPSLLSSLRPWFLVAALLIVTGEFLLARQRTGVHPRQWRISAALRILAALALLGAFFNIGINRDAHHVATVFVVDASDSLGINGQNEAVEFVRDALDEMPADARAAVVMFGRDSRIELLMQYQVSLSHPSVVVDPSGSNLAAALRLGGAILPSDARRRIVLVSDGRPTNGDVIHEAEQQRSRGVIVDTVSLNSANVGGDDIAITGVRVPSRVAEGDEAFIVVKLESTFEGSVDVTLFADDELLSSRHVDVVQGTQTVTFTDTATQIGLRRYQVRIASANDGIVQNNTAFAAVDVEGPPRVLVVEGKQDEGTRLAAALEAGGLNVHIIPVQLFPQLEDLLTYSSIVLANVDKNQMSNHQIRSLSGAVRDGGRGLVTIGGDQSYGVGNYHRSELELLLPVVSEVEAHQERKTVAQVIAVDTSSSMSGGLDGFNKTDIARASIARSAAVLSIDDEIGVLAFNTSERWAMQLQQPSQHAIDKAIATLNPGGGTDMTRVLGIAAEALRKSERSLKHIILFTDGFASGAELQGLITDAGSLASEGITVSVVATGEDASEQLVDVAKAGKGRFYPGRDLQKIPEIIMRETIRAARDYIEEGEFLPTITSSSPVVANLDTSPLLLGYVATTAKPLGSTLMTIGPKQDPLLVRWQIGLGAVTSWMSDASLRWSQQWARWGGYVGFWSKVVRDTFPSLSDGTTATIEDGVLHIRVESQSSFGEDAVAVARITDPSLSGRELVMNRTGANTFVGALPVDLAGSYVVGTSVVAADGSTTNGIAVTNESYSREYKPGVTNTVVMNRVAEAGGGRTNIAPASAFNTDDLIVGRSRIMFAYWLVPAAALLFLVAVIMSRYNFAPLVEAVSSRVQARRQRAVSVEKPLVARLRKVKSTVNPAVRPTATATTQPKPVAVVRPRVGKEELSAAEEDQQIIADLRKAEEVAKTKKKSSQTATVSSLLEQTRNRRQQDRRRKP
ncbi:MAG: VWA domain-containing protein [Acidimicrobiaceae bacterium]|nr:VWA domain-containing protein [Acidimicrobiaceae bacterium]